MVRETTSEFDQTVKMENVEVITPDEVINQTTIEVEVNDNLVQDMDEESADMLSDMLINQYESDKRSRSEYEATMKKGIDLLGLKLEDTHRPFEGACAAHHPLMVEAAVQFQSQAIKELYPANGPVKTKVVGVSSSDKIKQAERVRHFMNYQITEVMEEFFDDLDQMLFYLPIVGSCFKKIYYDDGVARPISRFIPVEDFVVSYDTPDLRSSGRYTHVIKITENELRKKIASGFYADMDMMESAIPETGEIENKIQEVQGFSRDISSKDKVYTLLEMHVDLDLEGFQDDEGIGLPYIVTICKDTSKILSIRANYSESDPEKKRIQHFVHYKFLPGFGFYGLGYVHLLGNLQKSATTILRSLIDAGQFANLPAGFKARGMRVEGGDTPIGFGEFRDVEGYGDDIKKSVIPLPFKEPSQVLTQLLGAMTDEGRRLAAITDMQVGDGNTQAPVGTTIALLEQGTKVMSSIHKRLHNTQKEELKILSRINADYLPDYYPYSVEGTSRFVFKKDFDGRVDVFPVSDPNIFSTAQRVILAQTQLQMATSAPQIHDLREAYRRMYEALNIANVEDILLPEMGEKPMDPATENFAMLQGRPTKAYGWQDHESHIAVHTAFMNDPSNLPQSGNPSMGQQAANKLMAMISSHIAEHKAHIYRQMIEEESKSELPTPPDYTMANIAKDDEYESLQPEKENEVAKAQAGAAQIIAQRNQALIQAQQNQQVMQDPRVQLMQQDLQLRQAEAQQEAQDDMMRNELKNKEIDLKNNLEVQKLQLEVQKMQMQKELEQLKLASQANVKTQERKSQEKREAGRIRSNERMVSTRGEKK